MLEAVAAERAHVCLECGGLLVGGASVAGGEQPVELVFSEPFGEPTEQEVGCAGQRNVAERDAERKLEERRGCGRGQMAEECALKLATAR